MSRSAAPALRRELGVITLAGRSVEVLGTTQEGIVMAREKHLLATVFHPELVSDARVHEYFLSMIP